MNRSLASWNTMAAMTRTISGLISAEMQHTMYLLQGVRAGS